MDDFGLNLPHDLDACHALLRQWADERQRQADTLAGQQETSARQQETIAQQQAIITRQEKTIEQQQETNERLQADLALLRRALYGRRRERFVDDPDQGYLFDLIIPEAAESSPANNSDGAANGNVTDAEQPTDAASTGTSRERRRTSKGRGRRLFPEFLPRKTVEHELKEEEIPEHLRDDPTARRFFKKTGEELEFLPASVYVIEHYQEVIVHEEPTGETTMVTAAKPPRLINAYTGPGCWAYLTVSRFADHLPYYRQEDILSRYGFRIGRSTQWRWMFEVAEGVRPLVDLMRCLALRSLVLSVDETPVTMLLNEPRGSMTTYLWATIGDMAHPYDCFYFTLGRGRAGPEEFLAGFEGYLLSDAYTCYEEIALDSDAIDKVACWAHARRKFEEIHVTAPSRHTHAALAYIQRLYDIEDRARTWSDADRYELRQREAKPIVAELQQWLLARAEHELPKARLRGAVGYMTNRWDAFERYLECGAIPIDNNRTEAALKYAILGRKAWLFFGNERGGEAAAILFTLTKTCNRHRIDPFAYLHDVYTRLPTTPASDLPSLLPDRWIAANPQHRIEERVNEAAQRAAVKRTRRAARRQAASA